MVQIMRRTPKTVIYHEHWFHLRFVNRIFTKLIKCLIQIWVALWKNEWHDRVSKIISHSEINPHKIVRVHFCCESHSFRENTWTVINWKYWSAIAATPADCMEWREINIEHTYFKLEISHYLVSVWSYKRWNKKGKYMPELSTTAI